MKTGSEVYSSFSASPEGIFIGADNGILYAFSYS